MNAANGAHDGNTGTAQMSVATSESVVTREPSEGAAVATGPAPDIRWHELGFAYLPTDHMYIARTELSTPAPPSTEKSRHKERQNEKAHSSDSGALAQPCWIRGSVVARQEITLSPAAAALNYAQIGFEGMKAMRTEQGAVVLFRPDENARRFRATAAKLGMPPFPREWFIDAVETLVREDAAWVPPYHESHWPKSRPAGSCSLYIRPVMLGSGAMLGVSPAMEYLFYIFASPVGTYRAPGKLLVLDSTHRAPAFGLGDVKAAANYPVTLRPYQTAKANGCVDVLYLDARHDQYIEEVGSSNFFAVLRDGTIVTPRQGSILPGISRDSVITIARQQYGWRVVERDISIHEVLDEAIEAFYTGTAAVLVEVTHIRYKGQDHELAGAPDLVKHMLDSTPAPDGIAPLTIAGVLKRTLQDIQLGRREDPFGWVHTVVPAGATGATGRHARAQRLS